MILSVDGATALANWPYQMTSQTLKELRFFKEFSLSHAIDIDIDIDIFCFVLLEAFSNDVVPKRGKKEQTSTLLPTTASMCVYIILQMRKMFDVSV